MFERVKTVIGMTFLFAMISGVLGPLFGFQQVTAQVKECYTHQVVDNTFVYWSALVGFLLGTVLEARTYIKSRLNSDYKN